MGGHSKTTKRARNGHVLRGLEKNGAALEPMLVGGEPTTAAEIAGMLDEHLGLLDEIDALEAKKRWLVQRERQMEKKVREKLVDFRRMLLVSRPRDPEMLASFGFEPDKKPGPKTAEVKAASAARARETRRLRRTMGKRQKAKIR